MDKILTIDGKEVGFRASALTPRLYRHKFGRDIVRDMNQLKKAYNKAMAARNLQVPAADAPEDVRAAYEEDRRDAELSVLDLEIFENMAFIMARQYDRTLPATPEEWLEGFQVFSIYEILPEIVNLWQLNQMTTSVPKKIKPTVREQTGATFMLRCAELGLFMDDLDDMTMGMVYDMLIERGNDQEEYVKIADQEDIYRLFGR